MKEDVLEQIVDDYLNFQGYFTTHNVPFRPNPKHPDFVKRKDSVPSDIDVIAIHPRKRGSHRVMVVTCKSWQGGFRADYLLEQLRREKPNPKRERWHHFRELWIPKWSEAFVDEVYERTGSREFQYRIAVTHLNGDPSGWEREQRINDNLPGCQLGFLDMSTMWNSVLEKLTKRPAASELARLAQLLKAAKLTGTSR